MMPEDPPQYLIPSTIGLPNGLPPLTYNRVSDGRIFFSGQNDDAWVHIAPKPPAFSKVRTGLAPPLASVTPPQIPTPGGPPGIGMAYSSGQNQTQNQGPEQDRALNYGVDIAGVKAHPGLTTNDPNYKPKAIAMPGVPGAPSTTNSATSSERQVPLPTAQDMPAPVPWLLILAALAAFLIVIGSRR